MTGAPFFSTRRPRGDWVYTLLVASVVSTRGTVQVYIVDHKYNYTNRQHIVLTKNINN